MTLVIDEAKKLSEIERILKEGIKRCPCRKLDSGAGRGHYSNRRRSG
jgi:hypothetical protein